MTKTKSKRSSPPSMKTSNKRSRNPYPMVRPVTPRAKAGEVRMLRPRFTTSRRELCDLEIHGLYIVEGIFYEGEQVVDLTVVQLKHVMRPRGSHKPFTFQLYGEDLYGHGIKHLRETGTLINAAAPKFEWHYSKSLSFLDSTTNNLVVYHATNMDKVRKWMYVSCPARCEDGWLRTIEELNRLFRSYVSPAFVDHAIVCPVCIGTELMKMQQDLRHQLDATSYVDMEDAMAFETKLNVRRRHLGYEFEQFDERRWGYHFDDMVSEDEFDDYEEGAEFEAWNEANDPNNQPRVRYRPFTNEQISMLPRNLFKYFKHAPSYRDEGKCPVCQENFKDEQHVTILPCAHAFCADGCIRQWLQRFDTCPTCRHRITADQILKPIKPITTTRDTAAAAQEEVDEEMEKKKVGGEVD